MKTRRGHFYKQVYCLLFIAGTTTNRMILKSDSHLQQFIAGVEVGSLLEDGCDSGGQHLVSGH